MSLSGLTLITTAFSPEQFPPAHGNEIILVGRSNVGKSSLLNRLGGSKSSPAAKNRARVSKKPGCTRSVNFYRWGDNLILVDLPGFGFSQLPPTVKQKLITLVEKYLAQRRGLSLILHVVDVRLPLQPLDFQMLEWGKHFYYPYLLTLNKCDRVSRSFLRKRRQEIERHLAAYGSWKPKLCAVSAVSGMGIGELKQLLLKQITELKTTNP